MGYFLLAAIRHSALNWVTPDSGQRKHAPVMCVSLTQIIALSVSPLANVRNSILISFCRLLRIIKFPLYIDFRRFPLQYNEINPGHQHELFLNFIFLSQGLYFKTSVLHSIQNVKSFSRNLKDKRISASDSS